MGFTFLREQAISKEVGDVFMLFHEESESSNVAESNWITDSDRDAFSKEVVLVLRFG